MCTWRSTFGRVAEVNREPVFSAVASARKDLAAARPRLPRGRAGAQAAKAAARARKTARPAMRCIVYHRCLFVQRHLETSQTKALWRVEP